MPRALTERTILLAALLAAAAAAPTAAQGTPPAAGAAGDTMLAEVYRREVFVYDRRGRTDPFRPLLNPADLGVRLEQLQLRGIIFNPNPRRSVAVFSQGDTAQSIRLRVGQRLGNITVVRIEPRRVDVRVDEFGTSRVVGMPVMQRAVPVATSADAGAGAPPAAGSAPVPGAQQATPTPSRPMPLQRRGAIRRQEQQQAPTSPQPTPRSDARPYQP